jgi:hypothetical protein
LSQVLPNRAHRLAHVVKGPLARVCRPVAAGVYLDTRHGKVVRQYGAGLY